MAALVKMQIGKKGLTSEFVENLKKAFNNVENVRVHLLKSAGHDRKKVKEIAEEIVSELGAKYTYRVIGFTIVVKKWRRKRI